MGGEGKLNTRPGVGSSEAGLIQYSQDISWQARHKTPGQFRPQRPGAKYSCVVNQEHYIHHCSIKNMPADCYKYAPVN